MDRARYEAFGGPLFAALDAGGVFATEYQMRRKDGSLFFTENTVTEVLDEAGQRAAVVSVVRDITERKRAEAALLERTRQLASLNEMARALTMELNPRRVAQEILAATQILIPGAVGRLWERVGDSEILRLIADIGLQEPTGGVAPTIRHGKGLTGIAAATRQPIICRNLTSDPRFLNRAWAAAEGLVSCIILPLVHGEEIQGILGIYTRIPNEFLDEEISLLRSFSAQAAIALENARLHAAEQERREQLEAVRAVTAEITRELDLPAVLSLIIRRAVELAGAKSGAVYLWDEAAQVLVPQVWHGLGDWIKEIHLRLGEGVSGAVAQRRAGMIVNDYRASPYAQPLFLEWSRFTAVLAEPLLYRDRLLGVITIDNEETGRAFSGEDREVMALFATHAAIAIQNARLYVAIQQHAATLEVRVRERTAKLEEALLVKAQFLANMSHELRTPLNAVLGFSEVLLGRGPGELTVKQERYLRQIQGGGQRLLTLVTDLLEMAESQAGLAHFRVDRVAVGDLVAEVLAPLAVAATAKEVDVTTDLDPGLPTVVADRRKLAQTLHHLVTNAIRYTPAGGRITVGARRIGTPEGEGAELAVADTGIGIRAEDLERIFRGFEQVDASDSRQYGGAGLGLALVRRLAELHGGRVWAESDGEGQGARFLVRLPLLAAPPAQRILVVEDEASVLEALGTALTAAGYLVDRAPTGAEALDRLAATPPSLLVLDIGLPDVDGWEVLRQVRRTEHTRDLPILVLTGLEHVHADQALALGADEFLAKPVSAQVLVETVGRLLRRPAAAAPALEERPPMSKEE